MLLVLTLGWATLQTARFLLPPLLPRIQATLGLTDAAAGLALMLFGLVYAAVQFPAGSYSDAMGRAVLVVAGCLVIFAALVGLAFATTPILFVGGIVLLGLGRGLYSSPSRALLGDLFSDDRGLALGIVSAGTDLGGLAGAGLAIVVLATATWRSAFLPLGLVLVLVTALFVFWNDEPYRFHRVSLDPTGTVRDIVATPARREVLLAFSLFHVAIGGLTNFFPLLLVAGGRTEAVASGVFAVLFLAGLVVKPVAGRVSDRFPRVAVSVIGLVVAAAGIAVVLLFDGLALVLVGTVLTAVGYKTQFPIADALVIESATDESVGASLGAARSVFLAANAMGPGLVGVVAQVRSYEAAFTVLAACLVLAAAVLGLQYRRESPTN